MTDGILKEVAGEANELDARPLERFVEGMRAQLTWARQETSSEQRQRLLAVAACAVRAIAQIDAEAEDGKYLERARALLVAAQGAGFIIASLRNGFHCYQHIPDHVLGEVCVSPSAQPSDGDVQKLARFLRERAR